MKWIIAAAILLTATTSFSQALYKETGTGPDKTLRGIIGRKDITSDSSFKWFKPNQAGYTAYSATVAAMKQHKDSISIIAFGGTWCHDTQFILPKFYSIADAAGISESRITVIGVDEQKKTIGTLAETFAVENVPTFIILKNGREIGRVVEYGKTGQWDKEIGDVIKSAF